MMHTVARFVFDVGLKWIVIGKREPGLYPWDRSSYCLRWKIFESLCSDTLHDLRYLGGSAFLPFFYNNCGSKIGRRVCLYPTGADPPMVEPDLVVVEDGACVNFAHIICHTNTLGSFALNHIVIKSGATLSTESRIMGGVVIGEDSVLLEHTMAMVGDVVEPGDIWQGWPVQAIAKAEDVAAAAAHSKAEGVTKQDILEVKFYGKTSNHGRVIHFKTANPGVINMAWDGTQSSNTATWWNQDLDLDQVRSRTRTFFFVKIMELGLKWVHMAPYELILRLDGALWLTIIFKTPLAPRRSMKMQNRQKDCFFSPREDATQFRHPSQTLAEGLGK